VAADTITTITNPGSVAGITGVKKPAGFPGQFPHGKVRKRFIIDELF